MNMNESTTARVTAVLQALHQLPGARPSVDIPGLARVLDSFFWSLLAQAVRLGDVELKRSIKSVTHLIYYAMFTDSPHKRRAE